MPPKRNPLNLNPLQLKTLTLLQELARLAGKPAGEDEPEGVAITEFPHAHGDHFHLGSLLQLPRDTRIFVPFVERESLFSTDCVLRLNQLGFTATALSGV